nr:putative ribonuclease H-like domain-containing protein [Tanacetum cinerariifolium]
MESLSPQVVSAAKLSILNPNEFDLWKMRIEQYFLMTDYLLWEVILNARKNELKARGTLLMALPDKHQLKFNTHKDAKTLMEAIEKRFGGNTETKKVQKTLLKQQYENFTGSCSESLDQIHDRLQKLISQLEILGRNKTDLEEQCLDDLFNILKIYEAEVKSSSSASTFTQNIAFVSSSNTDSTNEPVSAAASVSDVSAKIHVSSLLNVDSLSNDMIYSFFASHSSSPQLDNDDLKQIDADDPKEMDLKWKTAMLTVECYNCHRKGHFAKECRSPKDTRRNDAAEPQRRNVPVETSTSNALVSMCDGVGSYDWSFQADEEPTNYAFMAFSSSSSSSDNELRDNALVTLRQNLEKPKQERDDLKLKLEKFQTSFKSLSELLASQTNDKTGLGYNSQVFTRAMFDCDDYLFSGSDESLPPSSIYDRPSAPIIEDWVSDSEDESETKTQQNVLSFVQPTEQVKSPRPFVQHVKTSIPPENSKTAIPKPTSNAKHRNRKACFVCKSLDHLIKDCDYHEKKMAQTTTRNNAKKGNHKQPVTTVVPKTSVTRPRQAKTVVTKPNLLPRRLINHSPSPKASNFPPKVTTAKAPMVNAAKGNPQHNLKDKGVIDSRCSRHMIGNMSYLFDFEKLNGGYVAFGRNPKGGKISRKGKIKTGKLDFDDVYFVKELKFNLFSVTQMCDKKNSVLFTDTECLVLSPKFKLPDENHVLLRVPRENNMYNVNLKNIVPSGDLTCLFAKATLEESNLWYKRLGHINFKTINKLVKGYLVRGLPSKVFENDNTCVACNKGKQHRASYAAFDEKEHEFEGRKPEVEVNVSPSSKFKDFSDNSINKDNAAGTLVPAVGQISPNSTNTFSAAELEDITYSDDEDDVVSLIPTTRVHKDHHVTQIIGDLSSTTQIKSMTRVARDQGGYIKLLKIQVGLKLYRRSFFNSRCRKFGSELIYHMEKELLEEGIEYEEVFAPVVRIEAIRLFLAYAFFMGFMVYQMDVKSASLYKTIEEEIYVDDIIFGSTNKDLCKAFKMLMKDKFQMSLMGELTFFLGLQVKQKKDKIFISQDKYVAEILRKFGLTEGKSASTPIDTEKPLLKDPDVKRIFRYLKGKPHLGLWYPKDSPFDLMAYSDYDYAGASLDRKSTIGGCQFLGCRLISWQSKKQTVMATSSTKAEYVVAASYCTQVLWIQNQLLDYGVFEKDVACYKYLKCWLPHHTTNGSQFTMSNPHLELTSPYQTVSGKDSSNPLIADNLPKIVWYSTHHVALMKSWLVQKQTALGKDESNPFIVDSLLKTIW